jgi:hypothetical protein
VRALLGFVRNELVLPLAEELKQLRSDPLSDETRAHGAALATENRR